MITPTTDTTTPYDQDERFAELEELISALEAQWQSERETRED